MFFVLFFSLSASTRSEAASAQCLLGIPVKLLGLCTVVIERRKKDSQDISRRSNFDAAFSVLLKTRKNISVDAAKFKLR